MTRPADYVVFGVAVLAIPFLFGMGVGEDKARQQIATKCEAQPGGALAYSYQDKSGVACIYIETPRPEYGRVMRKKKATKA